MIAFSMAAIDELLRPVAEWLGTFALHSTVALGLSWLMVRLRRRQSLGLQDILLRQAMWLPFLSATLQYVFFGSIWAGLFAAPAITVDELVPLVGAMNSASVRLPDEAIELAAAPVVPWATIAVALAVACSLVGMFYLWCTWRRLLRILAARQPETDARVLSAAATMATHLGLRQSPHISTARGLSTPIAFGLLRPEICLPARATALDDASLRAMLGHELAHLRRADPAWMWLGAWVHAMFPWQLLLLASRREWSRIVELRCDAEAAQHTSPTAVARCLIEVAEWLRPQATQSVVALGMAARPSALRERVEAALGAGVPVPSNRTFAGGVAVFSLATLTMAAPGIGEHPSNVLSADAFTFALSEDTPAASQRLQPFLVMVEQEYGSLVAAAKSLQVELQVSGLPAMQMAAMQSQLQLRLSRLSQLHTRLLARVNRDSSHNR